LITQRTAGQAARDGAVKVGRNFSQDANSIHA
jgi:hypothetical protein